MASSDVSPDSSTRISSPPRTLSQPVQSDEDCFIVKSYDTLNCQPKSEVELTTGTDNVNNVYVDSNTIKCNNEQSKCNDILTLAPVTDINSQNATSSFDLNLDPLIMNTDVGDCFPHADVANLAGMNMASSLPQFQTLIGNTTNAAINVDTRLPLSSPPVPFNSYLHDHRSPGASGLHTPPPPVVSSPTAYFAGHPTRHSPIPNPCIGPTGDLRLWGAQNILLDSFDYSTFGHQNQTTGTYDTPREQSYPNVAYRPYEFHPIRPAPPPQPAYFPYSHHNQFNAGYRDISLSGLNHARPQVYHPMMNSQGLQHYPARIPPSPLSYAQTNVRCPPFGNSLTSALPAPISYQPPPSHTSTLGMRPLTNYQGDNNWPQNECPIRPATVRPPRYPQYQSTFSLAPRPEMQNMIGQPSVYALPPSTVNPALLNYGLPKKPQVSATKTLRDMQMPEYNQQSYTGISDIQGHEVPVVESTTNSPLVEHVDTLEQVPTPMSIQESAGPGSVQSEGVLDSRPEKDSELPREDLEPSQTVADIKCFSDPNTPLIVSPESPQHAEAMHDSVPLKCQNAMELDCLSPSEGIQGSNILLSSGGERAASSLSDVVLTGIDALQDLTDNQRLSPGDAAMSDMTTGFERPSSTNRISNYCGLPDIKLPEFKVGKVDASIHRQRAFDLVQVQIGSFVYDTRGHPTVKYARLKINFVKRILCYELELIKPSSGYETSTPFTIIELPFSTISGLEGEGRVLKIKVDAIPYMFLGQRPETEKARMKPVLYNREQPFDLTGGQIQTVPVHKVTLKAPNANKILSHFSLFDDRFCVIIKHCRIDDQATFPAGFQSNVVSSGTLHHERGEIELHCYEPQPKKKRCQRTHGCACKTGCRQERCKCVLNRRKCEEPCRCENCINPLNLLEASGYNLQHILSDLCLVKNVFKMQTLKSALNRRVGFPCCNVQAPFYTCIPGVVRCPNYESCHKEYKYSWCTDTLCDEAILPRNHCTVCDRCTGVHDLHCEECNWCYTPSIRKGNRCPRCLNSQLMRGEPVLIDPKINMLSPGRLRGTSRAVQGVTSNVTNAIQCVSDNVFCNATPASPSSSPELDIMHAFIQAGNEQEYNTEIQSSVPEPNKITTSSVIPTTSTEIISGEENFTVRESPIDENLMWATTTENIDNTNKDALFTEGFEGNPEENEPTPHGIITTSPISHGEDGLGKGDVIHACGTSNVVYHVTAALTTAAMNEVNAWSPMLDSEGFGEPVCASSPVMVCSDKDPKQDTVALIPDTERAA